ncbi:MAG: transaldolase family protein [Patescibacteria group bacterium]
MNVYLDTAILKEIEWAEERGLIDGITTNPTLLSKADRRLGDVVNDILATISDRPVHIYVVSQTADEIIEEAKTVAKLAKNIVVKVPMTDEGLLAVRELRAKNIKVNVTPVYSVTQALVAARAGAHAITVFDATTTALSTAEYDTIHDIMIAVQRAGYQMEVIIGGISTEKDVEKVLTLNFQGQTAVIPAIAVPSKVLVQMYRDPATDKGIKKFLDDWEKIPK